MDYLEPVMLQTIGSFAAIFLLSAPSQDANDYFPLEPAMKWTYETSDGKDVTKSVGDKKTIGSKECWRVDKFGPWGVFAAAVYVLPEKEGLTIQKFEGAHSSNPVTWLKYPLKQGDKWTSKAVFGDVAAILGMEVLGEEDIEVPAGRYRCFKVKTSFGDGEGSGGELITWYAKGVGEVKTEFSAVENGRRKTTSSRKLKKVEAGEKHRK